MESEKTEKNKTEKTIYGNRKVNHLNTHEGLEKGRGCFLEEKAKILGYFFKKSIKFLIDGDRSIKRL